VPELTECGKPLQILSIDFILILRACGHISAARAGDVMESAEIEIARQLVVLRVLVVDDEPTMRKVTRSLLRAIGVRTVYEAHDGNSGLEAIRTLLPDVVIVDWEMPSPNGPEFVRAVRSPATFPLPDVPIIMLTGHGERSRVIEAVNLGINEFLLKPVSTKALLGRFVTIIAKPRPMVRRGDYYGPEPRQLSSYRPEAESPWLQPASRDLRAASVR
jgi:two-component system, chemotaxis family, chemotaxis protein CheY